MKKLLFTFLALVMSLTLTACNNNNDTNGISQKGHRVTPHSRRCLSSVVNLLNP